MEFLTPISNQVTNLQEFEQSLSRYQGDFLSTFREPRSSKKMWNDLYFYVLGDPMKTKDNRIRTYIKQELQDNIEKQSNDYK